MKIRKLLIPGSKLGRYSIIAILVFIVLFILGRSIVIVKGPFARPGFFNDPIPAAITVIAGLFGASAFFTGLAAVIKDKERAIPVFIAAAIGLFIMVFWLGEVISPH